MHSQLSQGYWNDAKMLNNFLTEMRDEDFMKELASMIKDQSKLNEVWMTIIALWILNEKFEER